MTVEDHPSPAERWKHRRRMAYASMLGMLAYPFLAIVADSEALGVLAWPVYITLGGVVYSYIGASTYDDVKIGISR